MLDDIAVFDNLDHATDESLRSLWCVVDRYQSVGTLGRSGHCFWLMASVAIYIQGGDDEVRVLCGVGTRELYLRSLILVHMTLMI